MKPGLAERALAALLTAALLFFGGYFLGKSDERDDQQRREKKTLEAAVELHTQKAQAGQRVELAAVQRQEQTAGIFNGITHQVIDYAQNHATDPDCRLPDDGLQLWFAANAGAAALAPGHGAAALPAAAAAQERGTDGTAHQPPRHGPAVPRMPGPAPEPDRLAASHTKDGP